MTAGSWIYIGSQGIVRNLRDFLGDGAAAFRRQSRWKMDPYQPASVEGAPPSHSQPRWPERPCWPWMQTRPHRKAPADSLPG